MRDPLTPVQDYIEHAAARRIIVGVLLAMLLAALDQVMVATALPTIAASLADVENMSWVVTANLLMRHGRDAALRQAVGYPWPAYHDADRDQRLWGGFARLCAGALDADADPRAGDTGTWQRRPDAAGADHYWRRGVAARSAALSGLHLVDLHRVDGGRPDSRRLHRRASALVVDFLAQPAALRVRLSPHPQRVATVAATRPSARARRIGRRAHGGRRCRADACADLGRAALWLGIAANTRALLRLRRRCGSCSRGA